MHANIIDKNSLDDKAVRISKILQIEVLEIWDHVSNILLPNFVPYAGIKVQMIHILLVNKCLNYKSQKTWRVTMYIKELFG